MAENCHPNFMVSADDNKQKGCLSLRLRENTEKTQPGGAQPSRDAHGSSRATELSASDIDLMTVHHGYRQTAIKAWHRLD